MSKPNQIPTLFGKELFRNAAGDEYEALLTPGYTVRFLRYGSGSWGCMSTRDGTSDPTLAEAVTRAEAAIKSFHHDLSLAIK